MNATQRGCRGLLIFLAIAFILLILVPIIILPGMGIAVALPAITVPAEYYRKDWPSPSFELVNTLGGALLANVIVLFIAWRVWQASNGWTKKVPGRLQAGVEVLVNGLWGLTKSQADASNPRVRNLLFPIVASIFFFLLAANLGKLLPTVESVGVLHCAVYEPAPLSGFPVHENNFLGMTYFVQRSEAPLTTGTSGTPESYYQCEAMFGEHKYIKDGWLPRELDPFEDQAVIHVVEAGETLNSIAAEYQAQVEAIVAGELPASENRAEVQAELDASQYEAVKIDYSDPYAIYNSWDEIEISAASIVAANAPDGGETAIAFDEAAQEAEATEADGESAEAAQEEIPEGFQEVVVEEDDHSEGEAEDHGAGDDHGPTDADPLPFVVDGSTITQGDTVYTLPAGVTFDTPLAEGQTIIVRPELFGAEATTRSNQLYTVAPFVRGVATDLSFTIGLALLAFFLIQYFGVSELGLDYFQKFVNLRAIGNIGKNPIGGVDFVVGLFEIISEFGKIISLSFRLFGAIFAGTILYAVILFLTGAGIPVIILLLEIIVGTAQALVFAVLTLLFCAQAMESHHGDHDDHDDHH